ncbi:hypothetical protein NG799_09360 [Laspinema sp. D1]|uniref:Uncharacterized protein n=1 Tax=Laspinema palackyanum D2a TaxID=2953684 RepID=A0ABT2MP80_9CYAN|nr:hypothetical protein [Laspinema sp. D2a]
MLCVIQIRATTGPIAEYFDSFNEQKYLGGSEANLPSLPLGRQMLERL